MKIPKIDEFMKNYKKEMIKRKNSNEKSENLLNKQINTIVNDKFYNNENIINDEKNKNTTASDNKKNNNSNKKSADEDNKKISSNEVLVSKTPVKIVCKSEEEEINNNEKLNMSGVKKNLGDLFNQQTLQ
jgi:hypothetical protein